MGEMGRILVVNPFGLGDVIFSLTLVEAIKKERPSAVIGFLCNERTADLVRMDASVDHVFIFHRDGFREAWRNSRRSWFAKLKTLMDLVAGHKFDTMIDLSLGREYAFFAMLAGIKNRVGLDYKKRGFFLTKKKKIIGYRDRPVAETQLEVLHLLGIASGQISSRLPLRVPANAAQEMTDGRWLAMAPGGGRSWGKNAAFKQWNADRFAESADRYAAQHNARVLLLGDADEKDLLDRTAHLMKTKPMIMAGEDLPRVASCLLRSQVLLCNDGGLLHLANALGVPTVSLFGPVDEKVYGPLGNETPHRVITQNVPCRPCYKDFKFPPCPYDKKCLNEIPIDRAVEALEAVAK